MLGLMALSWLKINLKKKQKMDTVITLFKSTETNRSASCPIGSNFHRDLYSDYTSILEDFVNSVKAYTPAPISSSQK
jgi:hypothetical protein